MTEVPLPGLDCQNPLAFLAALGVLRVLTDDASTRGVSPPRLAFSNDALAVLTTDLDLDAIVTRILEDAGRQESNAALALSYTKGGERVPRNHPEAIHDLKPSKEIARAILDECSRASVRQAALAAAWFSELAQDRGGSTKPTAFHFTAGQQAFLEMVETLRSQITANDVREALYGPWLNTSQLPSLSWDATVSRNYALRAGDPSKEKRGSIPAANWLGVIALEFFPVVADGGRLVTTAIVGGWKDSSFYWPLWSAATTAKAVASLLRVDARCWTTDERAALGISRVHSSKISRSDQGGYGSFAPADVVLAKGRRKGAAPL
jgi:hypothetical protein